MDPDRKMCSDYPTRTMWLSFASPFHLLIYSTKSHQCSRYANYLTAHTSHNISRTPPSASPYAPTNPAARPH